jgi:molybdopterin-guanine dinucleotide biosynthesis protein A
LTVLPDLDVSGEGPLRGIYTALAATPAARVLVLACDLPFVTAGFLEHLVHADPEAALVVPRTARGLHPLCAVYARGCLPVVAEMLSRGELAVHGLTARVRTHVVPPAVVARFDPDDMLLHNVNTPGDLERAEAFARRHRDARMLPHGRPTVKRP